MSQNQAFTFMERIQPLPFGTEEDLAASPASLDQLFNDTLALPNLSLRQLRRTVAEDGLTFRIVGFEKDGTWEVRVNRDFDGDRILDAEEDALSPVTRAELERRGHSIRMRNKIAKIHGVRLFADGSMEAAADPRGPGVGAVVTPFPLAVTPDGQARVPPEIGKSD